MSGRSAAVNKLPLWRSLRKATKLAFGHPILFVRAAWIPFCAYTVLWIIYEFAILRGFIFPVSLALQFRIPGWWAGAGVSLLMSAAVIAAYSNFAVSWHRFLAGNEGLLGAARFWQRFSRIAAYMTVLSVAVSAIAYAGNSMAVWSASPSAQTMSVSDALLVIVLSFSVTAGLVISGLVLARLSLVFPAAALGHPLSPVTAWRLTRGNTWRLGIAFGLPTAAYIGLAATFQSAIPRVVSGSLRVEVFGLPWASVERVLAVGLSGRFLTYVFFAWVGAVAAVAHRELVLRSDRVVDVFT